MLNKILSLEGAQKLTKAEQKSIHGGLGLESGKCRLGTCPAYHFCRNGSCVYNPPPYGMG